jgi:hypothetical protein
MMCHKTVKLVLTKHFTGHTVKRCKAPLAEVNDSGGWNNGTTTDGGVSGSWDSVSGGETAAASGGWADDNTTAPGTTSWADDTGDTYSGGW